MKEKITNKQAACITILFIIGTSIVSAPGRSAKENVWISTILAYIIFIPIGLMYSRILEKFPGKNLFQINEIMLGKYVGKIINYLFMLHFFITCAGLLRNLGDFVYTVGPQETPMIVNMICLGLLAVFGVYVGISTLGRWCIIALPIIIFILLIPIPFLLQEMKVDRVIPIMYHGIRPVLKGTIETLAFPITQVSIFLMLFEDLDNPHKFKSIILKGVLGGTIVLFIIVVSTVLIEGGENYYTSYIPYYIALRRLTIGKFFERVEMIVLQTFVYTIFVKLAIIFMATMKGIGYIFSIKNYKIISTMIIFLAINLGYIFYSNLMEGIEFVINIWPWYALFFQVFLPFLIFIFTEIKFPKGVNANKD